MPTEILHYRRRSDVWQRSGGDLLILIAATAGTYVAQYYERPITAVLTYLTGVILVGARSGLRHGLLAGVVASLVFNFFLSDPVFRFGVSSLDEIVPLIAFNVCALVTGGLAGRLTDRANAAFAAEAKNALLLDISDNLQKAIRTSDVERIARASLANRGVTNLEIYVRKIDGLFRAGDAGKAIEAIQTFLRNEDEPQGVGQFKLYELVGANGDVGLVKFLFDEGDETRRWPTDMQSVVNLLALAIDRCLLLEQLAESQAVQRSEVLKNAILSSVSHDLRTPLTVIETSVGSLRSYDQNFTTNQKDEILATIAEQCHRLNRYTSNLLDMGRIQAGISSSQFEQVDVIEILGVALANVRRTFPDLPLEKSICVETAIVNANGPMLEQAIFNLLENAVVHGDSEEPLQVRLDRNEGSFNLEVEDRGMGIPSSELPHVFDRFYRSDHQSNHRGNGLGLYIAKGFVEAFGGTIAVESPVRDNVGTLVTIQLPASSVAGAP